ncbi:hypothetical protein FXO37_15327 [Capsicum annuum]|nr:hypothetical protein FXO37_15327 [Capsicum annuum]
MSSSLSSSSTSTTFLTCLVRLSATQLAPVSTLLEGFPHSSSRLTSNKCSSTEKGSGIEWGPGLVGTPGEVSDTRGEIDDEAYGFGEMDGGEVESMVGDDSSTLIMSTVDRETEEDGILPLMGDPKRASMSVKGGEVSWRRDSRRGAFLWRPYALAVEGLLVAKFYKEMQSGQ